MIEGSGRPRIKHHRISIAVALFSLFFSRPRAWFPLFTPNSVANWGHRERTKTGRRDGKDNVSNSKVPSTFVHYSSVPSHRENVLKLVRLVRRVDLGRLFFFFNLNHFSCHFFFSVYLRHWGTPWIHVIMPKQMRVDFKEATKIDFRMLPYPPTPPM